MLTSLLSRVRTRLQEDPRLARLVHGGASGLLCRGVSLLVGAVTLPLSVRYLGRLEYGVWITISTSVVMFSVLDLGVANTLTNFISESYAEDDHEKARGAFATAFWVTVAVSLLLGAALFYAWSLIHWGALLHLADPILIARARACVAISLAFFLISLPLNLANRVLAGYQEVHLTNYFSMVNSVLGLLAIVAVILVRGSIVAMMTAYCGAMLAGASALNLWVSLHRKPWIRPTPRHVRPQIVRALLGQGSLFFVLQLTNLVVFNSDNLVISHYLGASEVTPYSIAWRLISYASMLQAILIPSMWPAFTEAYRRRELDWVRGTYWSMMRKSTLAVGIVAVGIGLFGRAVIRIWAGAAAVPPQSLLWIMAFWAVLVSYTTNQSILLTATNRLRLEAIVAVLAAIANLALSIVLVQHIGARGVILATILSFLILMLLPQEREVRRILSGAFMPPAEDQTQPSLPTPAEVSL